MGSGAAAEAATIGREGTCGFIASFGAGASPTPGVVQVGGTPTRLQAAFEHEPAIRDLCLRALQALVGQVLQSAGCVGTHPPSSACAAGSRCCTTAPAVTRSA